MVLVQLYRSKEMVKTSVRTFFLIAILLFCTFEVSATSSTMDRVAESYVKLVLKVGVYDSDYVDAYNGPPEWMPTLKNGRKGSEFPHDELNQEVQSIIERLEGIDQSNLQNIEKKRYAYLMKSLLAAKAKIDLLAGIKMSFDEESKALYDAVAPSHDEEYYDIILKKLDDALPGKGTLCMRYWNYSKSLTVPQEKWEAVCRKAMAECRKRTLKYIELPNNENTHLEFVSGEIWPAYNKYKGNNQSLIQYNVDFGTHIAAAIHVASHEGYPGHHVNMLLMDNRMVAERNWVEYSVNILNSPQAFMAEGLARYATELVFPYDERVEFERTVLFPLAGLDPSKVGKYYEVEKLREELNLVMIEITRKYLDGDISRREAMTMFTKYGFSFSEEDERILTSMEDYRSYIINYYVGQDTVEKCIEKNVGADATTEKRWNAFHTLLSTPWTPSEMMNACE